MKYGLLSFIIFCGLLFLACNNKKNSEGNGDGISVEDFFELYSEVKLPFTYSDTSFPKNENDSISISKDIFYKFTNDSSFATFFEKSEQSKYYPIGKFYNGDEETYLLTRVVSKDKKILLLTAYNKNKQYIAALPLVRFDRNKSSAVSVTIDPKFNISKKITKRLPGDITVQGHDVYILNNSSKKFMLVMTDSLGEAMGELINPIDTLPQTQKYTGDYGNQSNLISFRDGQREGRMHMFVHINNEKQGCEGELKGEVIFTAPTIAEYRQGGDPCVLQFIFTNSGVEIKEVEGCGSRLGALECTFNGKYSKRKGLKKKSENLKEEKSKKQKDRNKT